MRDDPATLPACLDTARKMTGGIGCNHDIEVGGAATMTQSIISAIGFPGGSQTRYHALPHNGKQPAWICSGAIPMMLCD
ncbi:hypothetical protein QBC39DRAFT_420066 [Podospora conica]|nr:hypothetical protein QBC39DRAFT_420066 [Schizothecium conicum]